MKSNFMVLDCETGGLDCKLHPITQFAGLIVDETFKEVNRYNTFVRPYNELVITKKALELTMVTMSQINKGIELKEYVENVKAFAKQAYKGGGRFIYKPVICGHNVTFDIAFLKYAFALCGEDLADYFDSNNGEINYIDTIRIAEIKWPKFKHNEAGGKYALTFCCEKMGIKLNDAHGAMNDTVATWKLLKAFSDNLNEVPTAATTKVEKEAIADESEEKPRKFWRF